MITEVELAKSLVRFPRNAEILKLPWLRAIPVEDDDDVQFVIGLRKVWGSARGRDHGEAEVVALCRRYGWTAILDDSRGRDAAYRNSVPYVSSTGLLVAGAAFHRDDIAEVWDLHQRMVSPMSRPTLPGTEDFRPAFQAALMAVRKIVGGMEGGQWPHVLADPRIDKLVARATSSVRR